MGNRSLLLLAILVIGMAAPSGDLMTLIPGYPKSYPTNIYTGYLNTPSADRSLHYVFVESVKGTNNSDPVTLWLNGGPGCSSMLGFIQQIGPYYLQEGIDYVQGDTLTENPYSWHKVSNLLFLESPAGVGYSYNLNTTFEYTDSIVALDHFTAVLDFFSKYPEYTKNAFWLAGESYAGKYIPDLAVLVDRHNTKNPINPVNFKGIFVGNGVMDFEYLQQNQIQFVVDRQFVDPELDLYWHKSCKYDPLSAGCNFFYQRFTDNSKAINPYSVYDYCYHNDSFNSTAKRQFHSQESLLLAHVRGLKKGERPVFNSPTCAYFDGIHSYFNLNDQAFHAKFPGMQWDGPCSDNISARYHIDPAGSMSSYRKLLSRVNLYSFVLYNGDWDAVVPFIDTVENLKALNLRESYIYEPWFTDRQHSGFQQLYSGIFFATFKGASHQVPQKKRPEALNLFTNVLAGHPAEVLRRM